MTSQSNKDLFGRPDQGRNYNLFRPRYPKIFLQRILKQVPNDKRQSYLDVCCGTGQLLFPLSEHFVLSFGTDLSMKQLTNMPWEELKTPRDNVQVHKCDAHVIHKVDSLPKHFDLITIAQALHWLDIPRFLEAASALTPTTLAVTGYFCSGFEIALDSNNEQNTVCGDDIYNQFYNQTKDYYDFNREELFSRYATYDFSKHFEEVDYLELVQRQSFQISGFVNYLRTSSAYNTMIEKLKERGKTQDPVIKLVEQIEQRYLTETAKRMINSSNRIQQEVNILRKTSYFLRIFKCK